MGGTRASLGKEVDSPRIAGNKPMSRAAEDSAHRWHQVLPSRRPQNSNVHRGARALREKSAMPARMKREMKVSNCHSPLGLP